MFKNRLQKKYRHLRKWSLNNGCQAYRLYDRDIPQYPYIIDLLGNYAVVYERGKTGISDDKRQENIHLIQTSLQEVLAGALKGIIFKERTPQQRYQPTQQKATAPKSITIQEHQALFKLNLSDYLDYGLFLDHRPLRQWVFHLAHGKSVLNLFSYTCSMGVFAALGGARHTVNVDLSKTYLAWGKENYLLNKLSLKNHNFINQNALIYLQQASQSFDLIILDPPTFSNSKKMPQDFEVQRDHSPLIQACLDLLVPGGVLFFSTNLRTFKLDTRWSNSCQDVSAPSLGLDFSDSKVHYCFKFQKDKP